jgi:hypothetical protein
MIEPARGVLEVRLRRRSLGKRARTDEYGDHLIHKRSAPGLSLPGTSTAALPLSSRSGLSQPGLVQAVVGCAPSAAATIGGRYLRQTRCGQAEYKQRSKLDAETHRTSKRHGVASCLCHSSRRLVARDFFLQDLAVCSARAQTRGDAPLSLHIRCARALARSAPGASANTAKRLDSPHHVLVRCALVVLGASAGAEGELLLVKLPFHVFLGQQKRYSRGKRDV